MEGIRRPILTGFFRIGVNASRRFGRRSITTLRVSFRPFEDLMVRVPHHDPEHSGSILLTTLSLSMGRRVRVRQAHPTSKHPEEDRGAVSLPFESLRALSLSKRSNRSNRFMAQTSLKPHLILDDDNSLD